MSVRRISKGSTDRADVAGKKKSPIADGKKSWIINCDSLQICQIEAVKTLGQVFKTGPSTSSG
jgi:hypothetical protein